MVWNTEENIWMDAVCVCVCQLYTLRWCRWYALQCVWSDFFHVGKTRSLTWPRRLFVSDEKEGERNTLISSLSIFGFAFVFDSIIFFFSLFFLEKRKTLPFRLSGSNGGSCFKCWPCPFCFLALFFLLLLSGQEEEVEVDPPRGIFFKKEKFIFLSERFKQGMLSTSCLSFFFEI